MEETHFSKLQASQFYVQIHCYLISRTKSDIYEIKTSSSLYWIPKETLQKHHLQTNNWHTQFPARWYRMPHLKTDSLNYKGPAVVSTHRQQPSLTCNLWNSILLVGSYHSTLLPSRHIWCKAFHYSETNPKMESKNAKQPTAVANQQLLEWQTRNLTMVSSTKTVQRKTTHNILSWVGALLVYVVCSAWR